MIGCAAASRQSAVGGKKSGNFCCELTCHPFPRIYDLRAGWSQAFWTAPAERSGDGAFGAREVQGSSERVALRLPPPSKKLAEVWSGAGWRRCALGSPGAKN